MKKLLLLLGLTSCMVGPNYERPCVDVPDEWINNVAGDADLLNLAWWEQFNDPVLNDLIKVAYKQNLDLWIATARIKEFMGLYQVTSSDLYPKIYGNENVGRERVSEQVIPAVPGIRNPDNYYTLFGSGSWELDIWGKIRRATEASKADILASEEARQFVVQTLVVSVAATYVDLLRADRQLLISRQTGETRKHNLRVFQDRYDAGVISEIELSQATSEFEEAMARIPLFEREIVRIENALNVLLGQNPGPIARGNTLETLSAPQIPEDLPSDLLTRRPNIREAEFRLMAANARIGVARAAYFPSISLTGQYGYASLDFAKLFKDSAVAWNYYVPGSIPIFTAGEISGKVMVAESIKEQALAGYIKAIREGFADVEDALILYEKSNERLLALKRQEAALQTYATLARERYDEGYTSYLEVLDAERSLFDVQLLVSDTWAITFTSIAALYRAMGGGWINEVQQ